MSLAEQAAILFDCQLQDDILPLAEVPEFSERDVMELTRKIRFRQIALDLNNNGGEMPKDPEERKIFLAQLKDLDNQAAKILLIGAKEKASAADREAAIAAQRVLRMLGDNVMRREPAAGQEERPVPSIADAAGLQPLELVPDETQVGVDNTTYEELMERTGNNT